MKHLISLLLLVAAACGVELRQAAYRSMGEAEDAGAFERGWLPADLPRTTDLIREAHDLDTNVRWIAVEYHPAEYAELSRGYMTPGWQFIPYDTTRERVPFPDPPVEWWPNELRPAIANTAHTDVLTRVGEDFHRCGCSSSRRSVTCSFGTALNLLPVRSPGEPAGCRPNKRFQWTPAVHAFSSCAFGARPSPLNLGR